MAVFHASYRWRAGLEENKVVKIPAFVREELLAAASLLLVAASHTRWPISSRLSTTDATPGRGWSTETFAPNELAREIYRLTEQRGAYVRLGRDTLDAEKLLPAVDDVEAITRCLDWRVTRSHDFRIERHTNLQEMEEARLELMGQVDRDPTPGRHLNGTDSKVSLGAGCKGRSPSPSVNEILRKSIGWKVLGQILSSTGSPLKSYRPTTRRARFFCASLKRSTIGWRLG